MKNYHVHVRVFPWGDQLRAADGATQQDTAIAFGALINQKSHKTQRGTESHAASCNGQKWSKWNKRRCDCRDNEFTRLKSEVCPRRAGPAFKARLRACLLGRAPIPSENILRSRHAHSPDGLQLTHPRASSGREGSPGSINEWGAAIVAKGGGGGFCCNLSQG
jgi:hypothetical protein